MFEVTQGWQHCTQAKLWMVSKIVMLSNKLYSVSMPTQGTSKYQCHPLTFTFLLLPLLVIDFLPLINPLLILVPPLVPHTSYSFPSATNTCYSSHHTPVGLVSLNPNRNLTLLSFLGLSAPIYPASDRHPESVVLLSSGWSKVHGSLV